MSTAQTDTEILYEPDEKVPPMVGLGLGFQQVMGLLTGMAASTAIIVGASGQPEEYLSWVFYCSLTLSGLGAILMASRFWRFGTGYPLNVSNGTAYIAVAISALVAGGPAMLAALIVCGGAFQFVLAWRLALLRRIITPTVSGCVLMLLAGSVMSVLLEKLSVPPEGAPSAAGPLMAATTFFLVIAIRLFGSPKWQQWTPVISIGAGCLVAVPFGLFDVQPLLDAPWIGLPLDGRPGFDFNLGAEFWGLLPGFIVVALSTTVYGISDMLAIQRAAWRRPRAVDFRVVQGALNVIGVTNLVSAALGSLPNMAPPGNSARTIVTGAASRYVGFYGGAILIGIALLPKITALIIAVPGTVFGAFVVVMLSILFMQGVRMVVDEGLDMKKTVAVGVSFWLGMGFQNDLIFADLLSGTLATLLGNALTVGAICLIAFTLFFELTGSRRRRLTVDLDIASLPAIDTFLQESASKAGWNEASTDRLRSAGEETLSSLLPLDAGDEGTSKRNLLITSRRVDNKMELEFVAASDEENLEDRIAYLSAQPQIEDDREVSFRLLRHYASSVQHRKYHNLDIITVEVESSR